MGCYGIIYNSCYESLLPQLATFYLLGNKNDKPLVSNILWFIFRGPQKTQSFPSTFRTVLTKHKYIMAFVDTHRANCCNTSSLMTETRLSYIVNTMAADDLVFRRCSKAFRNIIVVLLLVSLPCSGYNQLAAYVNHDTWGNSIYVIRFLKFISFLNSGKMYNLRHYIIWVSCYQGP